MGDPISPPNKKTPESPGHQSPKGREQNTTRPVGPKPLPVQLAVGLYQAGQRWWKRGRQLPIAGNPRRVADNQRQASRWKDHPAGSSPEGQATPSWNADSVLA